MMLYGACFSDYYSRMLIIKLIFVVLLFSCLLIMLVRQREMIKVLKEIRDKK